MPELDISPNAAIIGKFRLGNGGSQSTCSNCSPRLGNLRRTADHSVSYKVSCKSYAEVADFIRQNGIHFLDACFADSFGYWHHCTVSSEECTEENLRRGYPFDASSIRLMEGINESDMLMLPDPSTCWIDPFCAHSTLHVTCDIVHPDGSPYDKCPRTLAKRCEAFLRQSEIADVISFGAEAEFMIFNDVQYRVTPHKCEFSVDGEEAYWNTHRGNNNSSGARRSGDQSANLGHRPLLKQAYFPVAPIDCLHDLRSEMLLTMKDLGMKVEKHHHEVSVCQMELGVTHANMVQAADNLMTYKYVVKNVARLNNKTATFMAKPVAGDNGNGMHCNQSLWKNGHNLFFDPNNAKLFNMSPLAIHYAAGILFHAKAIMAFTNPTTNSYKRLVPGFEAPVILALSFGNRSAAIRITKVDCQNPKTKRIEFRTPDPTCCPYLAFCASVLAGIDGIKRQLTPPPLATDDLFECEQAASQYDKAASSLEAALNFLEADHAFLTETGVFTAAYIKDYISIKRKEALSVNILPHPKEFELYYAA